MRNVHLDLDLFDFKSLPQNKWIIEWRGCRKKSWLVSVDIKLRKIPPDLPPCFSLSWISRSWNSSWRRSSDKGEEGRAGSPKSASPLGSAFAGILPTWNASWQEGDHSQGNSTEYLCREDKPHFKLWFQFGIQDSCGLWDFYFLFLWQDGDILILG